MALNDYYQCDVCGGKAFYDANIYDSRYVATYDPTEGCDPIAIKALCPSCAKTHEVIVREKEAGAASLNTETE
ncbi:hypothetical protein ROJ8625_04107 [Roseivivax jejudonensis]|uniref:Uncharacterized protein n=2 Tax=Roseivivax jejudonensis TaxID=1529041 RepID=A0A1X7AB78_9RHOB|nr:hypothetical protein ROJ8625_04107 [Roseivivax jejudonensis]